MADPATFLASNSVLGPYFCLRTACLFSHGKIQSIFHLLLCHHLINIINVKIIVPQNYIAPLWHVLVSSRFLQITADKPSHVTALVCPVAHTGLRPSPCLPLHAWVTWLILHLCFSPGSRLTFPSARSFFSPFCPPHDTRTPTDCTHLLLNPQLCNCCLSDKTAKIGTMGCFCSSASMLFLLVRDIVE